MTETKMNIKLTIINNITKIGTFKINKKVDEKIIKTENMDLRKINLPAGTYEAYKIDNNLMIIQKDCNINKINDWQWTFSGTYVDVEFNVFGFYDSSIMNILLDDNDYKELPNINFDNINNKKLEAGIIIDGSHLIKKHKIKGFGVMTSAKNGIYPCYMIENNKAIILIH